MEINLIWVIGRLDAGKGPLLNLTDGGDNPPIRFGNDNVFIKNKDVIEKVIADSFITGQGMGVIKW